MVGKFSRFVCPDFKKGTECNSSVSKRGDFAYSSDRVINILSELLMTIKSFTEEIHLTTKLNLIENPKNNKRWL